MKKKKNGDELFSPSIGQLNGLHGYRADQSNEHTHAVVVPRVIPSPLVVNTNDFHCSHGHSHEALLYKTAKKIGVKLEGELASCSGCSQAKGSRKPIKPYTTTRAVKPGGRVFVGLAGGGL